MPKPMHNAPHALPEFIRLRKRWLRLLTEAQLPDPPAELNALWRTTTNDPLPLLASSKITPHLARRLTRLVERRANMNP